MDYTNNLFVKELADKLRQCQSAEEARTCMARHMVEQDKKPPSETKICGQVHPGYLFIGCMDSPGNATNLYLSLSKNHISYQSEGMNMKGKSKVQQ